MPMPHRTHLPNRRYAETFNFDCSGLDYTATVSYREDGQLAEIFLNNSKASSAADVSARDAAVVCSLALQYGVPANVLRTALMRDVDGNSSGPLGAALDLVIEKAGDA